METKILHVIDNDHCFCHGRYSSGSAAADKIVSYREVYYIKKRIFKKDVTFNETKYEEIMMDLNYSVSDKVLVQYNLKEAKDYVLGFLRYGALVVAKINDKESKLFYMTNMDPKGYVPKWVLNSISKEQGLVAGNCKKKFADD